MTSQELETYIETMAQENPVIDLPESRYEQPESVSTDLQRKLDWLESTDLQNKIYYQQDREGRDSVENWHRPQESEDTLCDYLLSQILLTDYTDTQRSLIEFMIRSVDSRGYFTEDIEELADRFAVKEEEIFRLLRDIQALDPAGVGARDLKECLLLQLERKKDPNPLTKVLVRDYLDDIAKSHQRIIAKKLSVSVEEITASCKEIQSLNPKPGNAFSDREQLHYISPDVLIVRLEDRFEILINEYQYPSFTINSYYRDLAKQTDDTETRTYLREKITQAQWLSNCIRQRTSTLSRVMHLLVEKQQDFFLYGSGHKHPLKLTDLAQELDLHESTVSRAMRGKFLQCTWGVFPVNYFLTPIAARAGNQAEEKTPEQVREQIRQIIDSEDKKKPYSDQAISDILKSRGLELSRRTVNKYRVEMGIPD